MKSKPTMPHINIGTSAKPVCELCGDKGWRFRTPDGFNPFRAGGWNTIRAMYRVPCGDCSTKAEVSK